MTGATALFFINSAGAGIPIVHWTQPSGAQVFLVESPGIAMVDVRLEFDAGSRRDPADKPGLSPIFRGRHPERPGRNRGLSPNLCLVAAKGRRTTIFSLSIMQLQQFV